jgi:hypothetical protein
VQCHPEIPLAEFKEFDANLKKKHDAERKLVLEKARIQ